MPRYRRALRVLFGAALVAVGLVGLVLPIIPGIPLLVAGLAILGVQHPWLRPVYNWLERWGIDLRRRPREQSR